MTENQRKQQNQPPRGPFKQGGQNRPGSDKNGKKPGKYNKSPFSWLIITLIIVSILMMVSKMGQSRKISFVPQFMDMVEDGKVASVEISHTKITGKLSEKGISEKPEGATDTFEVSYIPEVVPQEELFKLFKQKGVIVNMSVDDSIWLPLLYNLLPILLLVGIIYFFFLRGMRGGGGGMLMNFGRSKHRTKNLNSPKVTFKDVAGIEEAKEEVAETIEFLKNPKKFRRIGGRIPRGVLLIGPPGCGKTLLAKAIAGESDVPFFSISGSDFVEMFVGVGASRVRDLFKQAKENSPCIIFLDEIDAIGKKRGPGFVSGGHDEREQTLNAILVEMDGFETNDQVIVIAATNRGDILDHALTRPGRFDRQVVVPLPDLQGRLEILKVHTKKIKMGEHVNLEKIARGTPMFTGAELEALINEAAIRASMEEKDCVEMADLEEARDKVRWGRAKRSRVIDEEDKTITAYHEAGHALVQSMLSDADPLHKVSIIPRGPYGGATFALPEKDRVHYTKKYCFAQMQVCFAGRIAEELFCDDITSGAQGDIKQATTIAREMVLNWGMGGETGLVDYTVENDMVESYFSPNQHHYSEKTVETLDKEIKDILRKAYDNSKEIIQENRDKLDNLAKALLKYETLDAGEVKMIIEGKTLDKPTVDQLLDIEKQKTGTEKKDESKQAKEPDTDAGFAPAENAQDTANESEKPAKDNKTPDAQPENDTQNEPETDNSPEDDTNTSK